MRPENGLGSIPLVSFWVASGPDSAAQGDNLFKYESAAREMVGPARVELATSRLSGVRSNHLSYEPISVWGKMQGRVGNRLMQALRGWLIKGRQAGVKLLLMRMKGAVLRMPGAAAISTGLFPFIIHVFSMSLRLIPHHTKFDFMGKRWIGFATSFALTLLSIGLIAWHGLNLGIDFTGGILMEVRTTGTPPLQEMREALNNQGFGEVTLQEFGKENDVLIRLQAQGNADQAQVAGRVKTLLAEKISGEIEYRRLDYVGPTVGDELMTQGALALICAFGVIMLYVWFRFEWQYGVGAILALLHDTIMVMGFYAVSQFEFGLTAIAALLTIVGYSINDSVVIYDRIRENMRKFKKMPINDLINLSLNETLSRTILTATTVLLASLALALFGGEVLAGFSWAMVFGTVVGTYSSIFISAPMLIYLGIRSTPSPALPAKA